MKTRIQRAEHFRFWTNTSGVSGRRDYGSTPLIGLNSLDYCNLDTRLQCRKDRMEITDTDSRTNKRVRDKVSQNFAAVNQCNGKYHTSVYAIQMQ